MYARVCIYVLGEQTVRVKKFQLCARNIRVRRLSFHAPWECVGFSA